MLINNYIYIYIAVAIGLPPLIKSASVELTDRVVGPCLRGEKRICLAITEVTRKLHTIMIIVIYKFTKITLFM